jgi:hypothetical protein
LRSMVPLGLPVSKRHNSFIVSFSLSDPRLPEASDSNSITVGSHDTFENTN